MKTKRNTYLLLLAVVSIWGLIIYKIINSLYPTKKIVEDQIVTTDFTPKPLKKQDTFSIATHPRDPFLGTLVSTTIKKKSAKKTTPSTPKKEELPQITIRFLGLITDKTNKQKTFFISINNQQYVMKINDEIQQVKLLKGNEKEIRIRYNNQLQTISLTP